MTRNADIAKILGRSEKANTLNASLISNSERDIIFVDGNNAADTTYDGIYWTDGSDTTGDGFNYGNLTWAAATGKVTVPTDGIYEVIWSSYHTSSGSENGHPQRWQIWINGALFTNAVSNAYLQSGETQFHSTTVYCDLSKDDEIQIKGGSSSSWRPRVYGGSGHTYLQVRRIR